MVRCSLTRADQPDPGNMRHSKKGEDGAVERQLLQRTTDHGQKDNQLLIISRTVMPEGIMGRTCSW